jgi:hypothetical protein
MSTPKKWIGFAALGTTATALLSRLWHRSGTSPKQAEPVETTN